MGFGNIETSAGHTDTEYLSKRNIKHPGTDTVVMNEQNVWKSIEWVFRIIQIGLIERTQNIFHKSLKCTSQF